MRQLTLLSIIPLAICALLSGCSGWKHTGNAETSPAATPSPASSAVPSDRPAETSDASVPLKEQISNMSIMEKIGQLVIVGLEGTSMTEQTRTMIVKHRVGGFILYKDNIEDVSQTIALLNALKKANTINRIPLWLSVDQEGGKVNRMPEPVLNTPSARQIGKAEDKRYSQAIGEAIGEVLRAIGFNMNYAPVLDIDSNPNNPVIGSRSFGSDPQTVIDHGLATMLALQSKRVAAVVKHFPGHGDTSVDSHLELPLVQKSLSELHAFELLPFKEAIKQDADAIMIAHLLIPQLDSKYPASLSKEVITDLLRQSLGYDGVVITDDMTMGGIANHFDIGAAAVRSVQAGSDILLVGHDPNSQLAVLGALRRAVKNNAIAEERLNESALRILRLKAKFGVLDTETEQAEPEAINRQRDWVPIKRNASKPSK